MKARKICYSVILLVLGFLIKPTTANSQDKFDMTIALDGSGDFASIQKAIDACKSFPDQQIIIHIKSGIYKEKVVIPAFNNKITLVGESPESTIITYDDYFGKMNRGRNSTFYTYTLLVEADDFHAENLTIENSAGPVGQAGQTGQVPPGIVLLINQSLKIKVLELII